MLNYTASNNLGVMIKDLLTISTSVSAMGIVIRFSQYQIGTAALRTEFHTLGPILASKVALTTLLIKLT